MRKYYWTIIIILLVNRFQKKIIWTHKLGQEYLKQTVISPCNHNFNIQPNTIVSLLFLMTENFDKEDYQ